MRILAVVVALMISAVGFARLPDSIASEIRMENYSDIRQTFHRRVATPVPSDSADIVRLKKKYFWRAAAETVGFNLSLWAFDRYVQKGEFAYISFKTIAANFRHGFEWDNDHLNTNMFAHPYNGSLFFNAGRSNGFNFWQSELFAIGGSAMWEMFMEKEYPSTNDIIATPIGGAAIGEVLYRTSDLVLDDRTSGFERAGREVAGFIISPMRGITRIVTGRAWERRATSGRRFGIPPISVDVALGARILAFHDENNIIKAGPSARISIEYGDKFAYSSRQPYDYFSFLMELDAVKTQPLLSRLEICGRLLSRELIDTRKCALSVGMYQHFDFFDSDTISDKNKKHLLSACNVPYKLGTPASLGAGVMFRYMEPGSMVLDAYGHFNAVILGGVLSDYYRYYHRNYNWASGFSVKGGISLFLPRSRFSFDAGYQLYRLYTWHGYQNSEGWTDANHNAHDNVQGDASKAFFHHLEGRVNFRILKNLSATFDIDWYYRYTKYDYTLSFEAGPGCIATTSSPLITSGQLGFNLMLNYIF